MIFFFFYLTGTARGDRYSWTTASGAKTRSGIWQLPAVYGTSLLQERASSFFFREATWACWVDFFHGGSFSDYSEQRACGLCNLVSFTGDARRWFMSFTAESERPRSWLALKKALELAFSPRAEKRHHLGQLLKARQNEMLEEYIESFRWLCLHAGAEASEVTRTLIFIEGLDNGLRKHVKLSQPENLQAAFQAARAIADLTPDMEGQSFSSGCFWWPTVLEEWWIWPVHTGRFAGVWKSIRKLETTFRIQEIPVPKTGTLLHLWSLWTLCQELSATPKRRPPVDKEVHLLAESRAPTLSAISSCSVSDSAGVKGVGRNSLLSMQGLISGLPAVILIDCGASHNFISRSWVEKNELKTEQLSTPLGVKLADSGPLRQVNFQTEVLPISVAPCSFSQSFAVIDMDGFDALYGKEWLSDCMQPTDWFCNSPRSTSERIIHCWWEEMPSIWFTWSKRRNSLFTLHLWSLGVEEFTQGLPRFSLLGGADCWYGIRTNPKAVQSGGRWAQGAGEGSFWKL